MAANLLEDSLRSLHDLYRDSGGRAKEQIDTVVGDVIQICLNELSEKDVDYCCSVLFDKEIGVVKFLQKIITAEEFQGCKAQLLDLLAGFTEKVGKKILDYAVDIKEISFSLFMRDRFAKVKNAAIPVLIKLLEVSAGSAMGDQLKVSKLTEKLFLELTKSSSKLQASVKANVYQLLGVISEVYPELMANYSERLVGLYVNALKAEMESKTRKPELTVIAGCLEGLTAYLVNFTQSAEEGSKNSYAIFKYARMAIDPGISFSRYDVPRGGLRLFGKHCGQFNQFIMDDYQGMYEKFLSWNRHHNRELAHLGMMAMESFLKQVAEMLVVRAQEGKKEGAVFKFFIQQFRNIMNDNMSGSKEVSLAIRGYGLLAAPCRSFLSPSDVQFMFSEMISKCEQQFLGQVEDLEDRIISLPSYLEALAYIVKEVDQVSDTYAATLEHLLVLLLENFPQVHAKLRFICQKAMLQVLLALMAKGTTFQQVLSGMVYQGLIRTCSHPVSLDTEQTEEQTADVVEKKVSYKDFIELWQTLLNSARIKSFASEDISIADRHRLTEAMYEELMTSTIKILNKLDLSSAAEKGEESVPEDGVETSADPTSGVQANRPRDFQVLINLVDFCRDLLPVCHYELFERWLFTFCHSVILLSTQNPLVSGFYKMLAVAMKIGNKLDYFKNVAPVSPVKSADAMDVDDAPGEGPQQKLVSYQLMKKFSKEVLVRMKQYRDDLLAACLTLVLALPKEIIAEQMTEIVPAIQVTLTLGLSYLPLAAIGLDALEYWSSHLPERILHPHYKDILPFLDNYIRTVDKGAEEVNVDSTVTVKSSKSKRGRKKVTVRKVKDKKMASDKGYESQLAVVKQRVMHYLGSLGGGINHALLSRADEEISKQAIAWDTKQHLKFDMPFIDMKPTIYFDQFLPHVVELATKSGDRQTKVAACELLHSLVLYTLGRGATLPGDKQKKMPMDRLYKKLFPTILQLACDVELVARQLFEPLTMQLIHWFTNNKMSESVETMALLDTIYDGIIQATDTGLRDFSARCLREFLKWSIKQTSKKTMEKSAVNAKSVLKRMFSFAVHPSAFKRLGAALAFNNFYAVFREEDALVDRFTFQILVHFVESLSIAHSDQKSLGTREQCTKALEHLEKIIKGRADMLKKESKLREEPREWSKKTLDIAVRWLTRQCGRPQTDCRHSCMKLVVSLAPLIPGIKAARTYFQTFLKSKEGPLYFLSRFEGGNQAEYGKMGLSSCPRMEDIADTFSLTAAVSWFDMLLAALDCYTWVFGQGFLTPEELFGGKSRGQVFSSIQYFCEKLALVDIQGASQLFTHQSTADFFTPRETDDYNRAKCTVMVRVLNLLMVMYGSHAKVAAKVIPESVLNQSLWELLCRCVVQPSSVGFNMGDIEIMEKLPKEMEQLLVVFKQFLPPSHLKQLNLTLKEQLKGDRDVVGLLPLSFTDAGVDHTGVQQLVAGYTQLHKHGLLMEAIKHGGDASKLAKKVMQNVYEGVIQKTGSHNSSVNLTPTAVSLARSLLHLAFQLGLPDDSLVDSLLESKFVLGLSQGLEQSHGDLFFTMFKSPISAHLAERSDQILVLLAKQAANDPRRVSSLLVSMVDHVVKDRALRKKEGERVLSAILMQWEFFRSWVFNKATADQQELVILLLTKMLQVDSKLASDTSHPAYTTLFEMYQTMLTDSRTNLAFKNRVLDLLPFFSVVGEPHISNLKRSLDRFVADHFPLKSAEFVKGSPKYNDYIASIDKLLAGLELSGSPVLLELIISIFCRESRHAHEEEIQATLIRFIKRLPADKQKVVLDVPLRIFQKEGSFPNEIRRATIERVCLPMLRLCQKTAFIEFYLDHIGEIMKVVETKLIKAVAEMETQLTSKQCCFQLLELLYSRMSKDEINTKNSTINDKFCSGNATTGKELTQKIIKTSQEAKSEDVRGETTLVEQRRLYHCAAYNLLIAVISCTQSDVKFFKGFLFNDDEAKGQFLLDNIVDKERTYEFTVELQNPLERKKKFVSIRNEVKEKRADEEDDTSITYGSSYHLASQYLADSSLSEDVSQYDFSMSGSAQSVTGDRSRGRGQFKRKASYTAVKEEEGNVTVEDDYVELEMDELNQHECMASVIALLRHMQREEITPAVAQGTLPKEMPSWMIYLHNKMMKATVHKNIKLFIAKLIINTADLFQPYAKFWLRPLCQFLFTDTVTSGGTNYFIVDLVVTMMSWHTTAIPQDSAEEKAMASRLVEFLTANIHHDTRFVFRNNLDLLKTLLECWKTRVDIPYHVIYKQLKTSDPKSKDSLTGIQVLGVIIACQFSPYGPSAPVDREKYFSAVVNAMGNHYKATYAPAAEVVGMIFKYLAEKERQTEGSFHDHVVTYMSSIQQSKPDNFIVCVHHMQRHYPAIATRFLNRLLFMLPSLHGEFRTQCLEVIHSGIDQVENVFLELHSKGLLKFLTHRDEDTQQMSLRIVKSIAAKLKPEELSKLMSAVCSISQHPSTSCRNTMYEILMWIYDNYRDDESEEGHQIMQQTKETLLLGLGDEDLHCRLLVQNFWSSETRLPTGTLDRMVAMLEAMYSPSTEQQYLSYATNLLLEMTSKSPDYQREIFEHALSECKFQDYSIHSSWRQRHAVMTPLFASTQATQTMDTTMMEDSLDGGVRATVDAAQFTQTQEAGSRAPFNWLTQSSLDSFSDAFTLGGETQTQSSLLFSVGGGDSRTKSRRPRPKGPGPGFGQRPGPSQATAGADVKKENPGSSQQSDILRLKRRFLKDQEASRLYFVKKASRMNKMRETARLEQQKRRENQVTMYRKYRIGDLPDIQIKYSYIIAPLQAVAHRDSTVAKLLFSSLFKAIFAKMDTVKTEREIEEMNEQINKSLDSIFSLSSQYFPPFLSCIMDILYDLRTTLKVEPANLGVCAVISNLQPLGLTVMEEQLIQCNTEEARPSKHGKMEATTVSLDTSLWIEMARLYKSVDEYDVLQGIFSGKIKTKPITREALEAEARGDYQGARKLYEEALSCDDWEGGEPTDAEVDLWDDARMECLDHLTQWEALQEVCNNGIDSTGSGTLNNVWDDSFAQEHYLPYLLRSKLKLMLQGNEKQQSLLTFIDDAMKDVERKVLLESRYCFELALMYLWQEDYDRARHYSTMASQKFLQDWSSTDTLMASSRTCQLQRLQPLMELQEFLAFRSTESNFSSTGPAQRLAQQWERRSPHLLLDTTDTWDDIVTNRNVFLDLICNRLSQQTMKNDSMEEMVEEDMFEDTKLRLKLAMAESARDQNNFTLTLRILRETHGRCKRGGDERLLVEWSQLYASTHHRKATSSLDQWTDDTFNNVLTTLDQLGKYSGSGVLTERSDLGRRHCVLTGQAFQMLGEGLSSLGDMKDLSQKTSDKLLEYCGGKKVSLEEMKNKLVERGYREMKSSVSADNEREVRQSKYGCDEAYLAVAKYCDKVLRDLEDEEADLSPAVAKTFPDTVVVCMLKAMKLGSVEARERFPRLMQLVEYYPETMATFREKSREVPNWMFMLWLAQMMALLDKKEAPAVQPIVVSLATDYPQAVIYPFRISCEGFVFGKTPQDTKNKQAVEEISSLLTEDRVPLVSKFISALNQFGQPEMLFKDWATDMSKLLHSSKKTKEKILEMYQEMYEGLIEHKTIASSLEPSGTQLSILTGTGSVGFGEYRKKFADKFKKEMDTHFGKEGSKLVSMSYKEFGKIVKTFNDEFDKLKEGRGAMLNPPTTLRLYCQWMSDFNPNRESRDLEIPGQYDGLSKPLPEYHVKVAGFDDRVLVMSSIRKPKRITIRGNDEKDYHYLVKGGEDLRQDQRIEQLFVIMNKVMAKDPACRQRKLKLKTYQVIPMTPRVGLIEWMNNTCPLKDFLLDALTDEEKKFINSDQGPSKVHQRWTGKFFDPKKGVAAMYSQVYMKYNKTETEREFRLKESKVPWGLSRRAFHQMSTSPEAFHVLRCGLATSHAVISICQYILGIGDRHLSNFMVNLKTGHMVGIDFGHAFGSATQFLPVPELMPFRLTRQIVNVMLPLQVKGLLENTMVHVLRALRNDYDLLLSTMDVFVKEPSVDWMQFAEKQVQAGMKTEDADVDAAWYPKQKIRFAQQKLRGDNPCFITREELRLGHSRNIAIKSMEEVLLGNKKEHVRAQLPRMGLSVEQQVAALIDQATDPNLLGRVWAGWEAWM
ncbi:DNA-dependent protein kinase catalytic subunit-like [Haliotis rufescens]|uniref:DNA-dependent protein kinase catalytic subunit-like n=1 Tax=Haliotis rufescens TaxID=6454 RepID=UPI00201F5FF6|nr:DNA-dependent protein kinase catalytic subunit-like [Haliotis rufescens]